MPLPNYIVDLRRELKQGISDVMGVTDMRSMLQMQQAGGEMDTEALLEYVGPSIRTRGRVLEVFMREVGEMMKSNFFQFYNMGRRIQILGKDGIDFEDFDFDPGSLVPSFDPRSLPPQDINKFYHTWNEDNGLGGQMPMFQLKPRSDRAYEHMKSFVFYLTPNSLLNMSKRQDQLMYMQLFRMGCIDMQTLLEKLDVPNIGELPGGPQTILERMAAAAQSNAVGAVSAAGRKASGQQMPEMRPDLKMSESG